MVAPRAIGAAERVGRAVVGTAGGALQVSAVLERPSNPPFTERPAQTILTARGDTVEALAASFHSDPAAIRWANGLPGSSQPAPGARLLIPPGSGALVRVDRNATLSGFAGSLNVDPRVLLDFNQLADAPLRAGTYVQLPRQVAPGGALPSSIVTMLPSGAPAVLPTQHARGTDTFPFGQCTYYVASRRNVSWAGDAWAWWANARAAGRPEGHVPVAGAIVVMWGSWFGHVAYVDRVNPDGSFVISEMNVRGWGVVDQRTLGPDALIVGFIY